MGTHELYKEAEDTTMSKNAPLSPNSTAWTVSHKWTANGYRYDLDDVENGILTRIITAMRKRL